MIPLGNAEEGKGCPFPLKWSLLKGKKETIIYGERNCENKSWIAFVHDTTFYSVVYQHCGHRHPSVSSSLALYILYELVIQAVLRYLRYLAGILNCLLGEPSNPHGAPCSSSQCDVSSRVTLIFLFEFFPLSCKTFLLLKWDCLGT